MIRRIKQTARLSTLVVLAGTVNAQLVTKLSPDANTAFEAYVRSAEAAMQGKPRPDAPFEWLDGTQVARVRAGETSVRALAQPNPKPAAGGLIHDWVGGIFFKGATVDQVAGALRDFARHKEWYPEVIDSKLVSTTPDVVTGSWLLRRTKVITVVLRVEIGAQLVRLSDRKVRIVTRSQPVVEVDNHGKPGQRDYPAAEGHGFLWRFNAYWNLQQDADGVFGECRIVSLSRDVPSGLGWIPAMTQAE